MYHLSQFNERMESVLNAQRTKQQRLRPFLYLPETRRSECVTGAGKLLCKQALKSEMYIEIVTNHNMHAQQHSIVVVKKCLFHPQHKFV